MISKTAALAQMYNNSDDTWEQDNWRYNHSDTIGKSELNRLRHHGLLEKADTPWSNTTWTWTDDYYTAKSLLTNSSLGELPEEKLEVIEHHADTIEDFPLYDTFYAADFDLVGCIRVYSTNGVITRADNNGSKAAEWELSGDVQRAFVQMLSQKIQEE